jgi:mannose-6-phosphate isomerase-like protein (cupin superfamily)
VTSGPGIVGYLNGYKLQIVKAHGPFVWHKHEETDDFFLVIDGRLTIHLRDRDVELGPGTVNTGDAGGAMTAEPMEL